MKWHGRLAILAVFVFAELSIGDVIPPSIGLSGLAIAAVVAWRTVPRFWRMLVGGLVGGAIAGLLILGPGFRIAMRVVALMDPTRAPEFTLGGTLFIVVFFGAAIGAIQGLTSHALRRMLNIGSSVLAGSLVGLFMIGQLAFFTEGTSDEVFELGAGALVNIPLFGTITVAYGIAMMALAERLEHWRLSTESTRREKVPA